MGFAGWREPTEEQIMTFTIDVFWLGFCSGIAVTLVLIVAWATIYTNKKKINIKK
jgi:hypothetical protein